MGGEKMSEIKPRQISYWVDSYGNRFISHDEAVEFSGSDKGLEQILVAAPVLQLMAEMAECLEFTIIDEGGGSHGVFADNNPEAKRLVGSYKSFLSQIESEAGE